MPITTYGDISPRVGQYASVQMLAHAEPIVILDKLAQARPMPANKGQLCKFRRPRPFAPALTPLAEGVTPASQKIVYEDVPATLAQYGAFAELTDVIADTHEDPVLKDMSMLCSEQAVETRELLNWGVINGGTNVIYAGGVVNRAAVNKKLTLNELRLATRTLRAQRAKAITKILGPSVNIATRPIEGGYIAVGHTDMEADCRNITGFTPVAEYGQRQPICAEEIGSVENIRIILSPMFDPLDNAGGTAATNGMVTTGGTATDVYRLVILGHDAWGTVPLKGKDSIRPMVLNPNTPRGGDPLGQRGSVGWKTWHTAVILNQAWMVRVECGVSKLD
jgi:N4-gp56 family major capsid protein